jgi:hypothetical protein
MTSKPVPAENPVLVVGVVVRDFFVAFRLEHRFAALTFIEEHADDRRHDLDSLMTAALAGDRCVESHFDGGATDDCQSSPIWRTGAASTSRSLVALTSNIGGPSAADIDPRATACASFETKPLSLPSLELDVPKLGPGRCRESENQRGRRCSDGMRVHKGSCFNQKKYATLTATRTV